jgi:hypothetical protein
MRRLRILAACEESQAVTIEMRKKGYEAYSCDIQDCSGGHPEWHIKGDVLRLLNGDCYFETMDGTSHVIVGKWDMIIAHPPCTFLSNAGACRLYPKKGQIDMQRYAKGLEAKEFFMAFYNADCPRIAVENPMPSSVFELPPPTQWIQPYQMQYEEEGIVHPYTKKTGLWIKGMKPLVPTSPDAMPVGPFVPSGTGRKDRSKYGAAKRGEDAKNRSKTFPGIAKAMAEQWAGEAERT